MKKRILSILLCCILALGLTPMIAFAEETQTGTATIVLVNSLDWHDNSGYQILLDADHDVYGDVLPEIGPLTRNADASAEVYDRFEHKLPKNADGARDTANSIFPGKSEIITIPAGTYDYVITNPTPGDNVWIASNNGTQPGRADDYVFEAGKIYVFTISKMGSYDSVSLAVYEHEHTYGDWYGNETDHWHQCTDPDCPISADSILDKGVHEEGTAATCNKAAVCSVCGLEYGDLNPGNHSDLKHVDAKAATVSAEGNIEYWYCEGCNKYYSDPNTLKEITKADTVIAKLPGIPSSPETGDSDNPLLWIALFVISGAAIVTAIIIKKKKA